MSAAPSPREVELDNSGAIIPLEDGAAWNRFVENADAGTFCHLAVWREIMADVLGAEPLYRVHVDVEGCWQGVLPLLRVKSRLFGHYLLSMPFLNYGGPLGTPAAQSALTQFAAAEGRRSGADLVELRARHSVPCELPISSRKITVVLELPNSAEALWREGFSGKLRSQIRRPQKDGMEARFGLEQWEPYYEVFARHMRDLGTPVLPGRLFERIAAALPGSAEFGVVYDGDRPVAAGCGFVWRDEFELTWASALLEYKRAAPNMLLYWSFMERMIARGVQVFNFGRCTPGGGTHRFKLQWGGSDLKLPWLQWSPAEVSATPSPDRPVFRLAASVWRRIPRRIANRLGPILARRLP